MNKPSSNIASCLTPAGRSAIATILVQGPQAAQMVDAHFRPHGPTPFRSAAIGRVVVGTWRAGTPNGEEMVACRTAEQRVEVHCHGGHAAPQAVLNCLQSAGCQIVPWHDLPDADALTLECRQALANARTQRTAVILLDQYRGALRRALDQLDASLARGDLMQCRRQLQSLLQFRRLGPHLTEPWQVVLAGAPNVGKSCLINAMVGYQRAIVSDQPGTTRDVVTARTVVDGWPVELSDTAGIRESDEPIEAAGVAQTFRRLEDGDLIVFVQDARHADSQPREEFAERFPDAILVINKTDLIPSPATWPINVVATSAVTLDGIDRLLTEIASRLIKQPPNAGTAVPFTKRQFQELEAVEIAVKRGNETQARQRLQQLRHGSITA